jgi:hypothetical protein
MENPTRRSFPADQEQKILPHFQHLLILVRVVRERTPTLFNQERQNGGGNGDRQQFPVVQRLIHLKDEEAGWKGRVLNMTGHFCAHRRASLHDGTQSSERK